ncbi:MAG: (d)CMP kinase [Syntrophaceticus sp.]|nr:(d)CMP kinase [Syntrophaceticus sp.]MDD4359659.1 (d)CMP kinase [Syntrophaceticus sp.]MDD4782922.1 (d)CMP kinase [Syntrophaceticus sp.]
MSRKPNIAIDGPAGSGKSTVARELAHRLGFLYVDTGAMYRAVTYFAKKTGTDVEDEQELSTLVKGMRFSLIRYTKDNIVTLWCNGEDVTPHLREKIVAGNVSKVAAATSVREYLVRYQQFFARTGGVVMEGRDIGTVVLPDAEYKFFLTASLDERLKRRGKELQAVGRAWTKEELRYELTYRDEMDSKREIGPLKKAPDALVIDSTNLIVSQVIEKILESYGGG